MALIPSYTRNAPYIPFKKVLGTVFHTSQNVLALSPGMHVLKDVKYLSEYTVHAYQQDFLH